MKAVRNLAANPEPRLTLQEGQSKPRPPQGPGAAAHHSYQTKKKKKKKNEKELEEAEILEG